MTFSTFADEKTSLEMANIGIEHDTREQIVEKLNILLADEHLLYTKTRNFHWNVTGVEFKMLHELLEEQYNTLQKIADQVAERARMMGGTAIGSMSEFLELTRLSEIQGSLLGERTMLASLQDDHEALISFLRNDIDQCTEEFGDEGTADLLIGIMRSHEQMAWMLRASLRE